MSSDNRSPLPSTPTPKPPSTPTTSSAAETHTVKVGPKEDPHGYVPHELKAKVGDLVVFEFYPRNHSVVQADWKAPCMPADGDYFFSGIKNDFEEVNGQVVGALPTWNWTVEKNEPTFFYCTGTDSCITNGMVGVINPNKTHTWDSQNIAARDAPYMLLPGQSMPAEGDNPGTGTSATHISSSTPTSDSSSRPSPSLPSFSSSHVLGAGAIAGIVLGSVTFVAILCVLLFLLGRNRVYKKWLSQSHEGSGSGASSKDVRTAKWALSTSAAAAAAAENHNARSEPHNGPGNGLGIGYSLAETGTRPGNGMGFSPRDPSMDHTGDLTPTQMRSDRQSAIFSSSKSVYGFSTPQMWPQMQMQAPQPQPGQQPYWIWDQAIQPQLQGHHMAQTQPQARARARARAQAGMREAEGPSELEGETRR